MLKSIGARLALATTISVLATGAIAAPAAISTGNPSNGLTAIFSTSFAGALPACTGGSPSYCSFFGGLPSGGQLAAVSISPNPSGVVSGAPGGIGPTGIPVAPIPAAGSFLDITLSGGNTVATLNGGSITFGNASITVIPAATTAAVSGAGFVLDGGPNVTSVNGSGFAEFLVTAPVDFSRFSQVTTGCTGPVCGLITGDVLNLDMIRYRLAVQWDPSFTNFNATFIGQASNNAMVFANLSTVPVPAAVWMMGSALGLLGFARRKAAKAA
ncbi:MAG: hypothetical protein J0M16_04115 [Gammaproteobacteria bacterium]|nr:hypothetical protein [Gammaproteobacteria bacterium]